MPHDLILAPGHDRSRSLGWVAVRWIEWMCLYGRGDVAGTRLHLNYPGAIPLSNELVELIVDAYALEPDGRRLYDMVFYSRPKGSNKSGVAAWIGAFEAMGPCRFDGWAKGGEVFEQLGFRYVYRAGEPMGRPIVHPFLRIMATEESQTGHVYDELMYTLVNGPLRMAFERGDDIGLGRVILPDGGEIRPSTASSSAKDGGLESWVCFDEVHLYYKPELIRMFETVTRNLAKREAAQPWAFIPTTMYEPGRGSIAELLHDEAREIQAGTAAASRLLFNHRYAGAETNMDDDASFEAGLREAYGDAAEYIDIKGLMQRRRSKTASREYTAQFFLNQATASGGRAFDLAKWDASVVEKPKKYMKRGEMIALGFDGSRTQDSTSLKATHVASGFQWRVATWERPEHAVDWEVPEEEVDSAIAETFARYRVVLMYADTSKWEAAVSRWAGKYNHGDEAKAIVVKWPVQLHKKTAVALKSYALAIANGEVLHGDDPLARRHLANAYRLPQNFTDDDGSALWLIGKERQMSPNKIDDAYAGMLSWQARNDAIAKGVLNEAGPSVYESRGVLSL